MSYICPHCKTQFPDKNTEFPFCSKNCKLKDLGDWAMERFKIPGEATDSADFMSEDEQKNSDSNNQIH